MELVPCVVMVGVVTSRATEPMHEVSPHLRPTFLVANYKHVARRPRRHRRVPPRAAALADPPDGGEDGVTIGAAVHPEQVSVGRVGLGMIRSEQSLP